MSYRAFKRLLGETSLERKYRPILGIATLLLTTGSFWWYARQTEGLVYDQTAIIGRLLVRPLIEKQHEKLYRSSLAAEAKENGEPVKPSARRLTTDEWERLRRAMDTLADQELPESLQRYQRHLIIPNATNRENVPDDPYEHRLVQEFQTDESKNEQSRIMPAQPFVYYYAAIRASPSCMASACHPLASERDAYDAGNGNYLMAVANIRVPTDEFEKGINQNRALLITTALVIAILFMAGSWLIVRYIIVKPIKHLKEVSDAISAGELNLRSEIQTGDEFEDLSHAFNRMLRNLVSMQDRLRKANLDLDLKVDELAQANMALYESNRIKGDFLATMSHELRTPLNSVLGFSEVLLSSEPLNEKQKRWAGNIQSSGEQLLALINDILDLAKIEAGKMQIRIEEFSILDVFEGMLNMFRPMAERKNLDLRTQVETNIPLLRQDPGKLRQILSNLLSNAIKFTPEGGRIVVRAEADPVYIGITVTDTGVGIAPEDQELIFEKFRQAGNPLTREHAGTGLGLSIVRELTKLLGGEVTLQSELGRGSTFTVRLPIHLSQEPKLEFDLADHRIDLSKAQRVEGRSGHSLPTAERQADSEDGEQARSEGSEMLERKN
jgi:signal transduction histidine kinase